MLSTERFLTGEWQEDEDHILNKVAVMLMAHKSGLKKGQPVSRDEIEDHTPSPLPDRKNVRKLTD